LHFPYCLNATISGQRQQFEFRMAFDLADSSRASFTL
jgi:hypothetical protein